MASGQLATLISPAYNAAISGLQRRKNRGFGMASERLSRHIERLLDEADEALTQRR